MLRSEHHVTGHPGQLVGNQYAVHYIILVILRTEISMP